MRGHVRKRGKKWCIVVDLGQNENGKRKQKWISGFKTKKEAENDLSRILNDLLNGTYVEPNKLTVNEYIKRWLEFKKTKVSARTVEIYESFIRNHVIPAFGQYLLMRLQPIQIQDFYNRVLQEGTLTASTVHRLHYLLKNAFMQAVKWQLLMRNPIDLVDAPRVVHREMKVFDESQITHLLEFARGEKMYYMAILLAVTTGMRKGEICALRWKNIDFDNAKLKVEHTLQVNGGKPIFKAPKTPKSRRTIDLPSFVVDELKHHKVEQNKQRLLSGNAYQNYGLVCAMPDGKPFHLTCINDSFTRLLKKADLPHIRFHDLRHTHTTQLFRHNVNIKVISERLGHASIKITLEKYAHLLPSMQKEAASLIDRIFSKVIQGSKQ